MYLQLLEKKQELEDVTSFIFEPETPLDCRAGQYLHYVLHHLPTDDRGSDRWFTNSAAPFENNIRITTRFNEKGSSFKKVLRELEVGGWIEISVIEGEFTLEEPEKQYVFLAGGIGITPYRSIIAQLAHEKKPINITLIYANRDGNIVFKEELDGIARDNPNFKIHYLIAPEFIDETRIRELAPDLSTNLFYISGPEPMVEALSGTLKKMGIDESHIKEDSFPGYQAV
ncbi:MAG TPA: FAD-dependent oxidoreductase [Dehalococcoidia bacterium]|nr:FAD-dependent oxidoreductase [Dehalococcoidia bacterium]